MDENREEIENEVVPEGESASVERQSDLQESPQYLLKKIRNRWKYIVVLLVVFGIIIAGGIYLKNYSERSDPEYYVKHQGMGMKYFSQGIYDVAIEEFLKAQKSRPESFDPNYGLGLAYLKQRKMEDAVINLEKATSASPDRIDAKYSLAVSYQRMGRFEKALGVYHEIAKMEPDSPQVFSNIGVIQMKLGDHAKAIKAIKHAIELSPDYYPSYFNLAQVYLEEGKTNLALEQYEFIRESAAKKPETEKFVKLAERRLTELKQSKDKGK